MGQHDLSGSGPHQYHLGFFAKDFGAGRVVRVKKSHGVKWDKADSRRGKQQIGRDVARGLDGPPGNFAKRPEGDRVYEANFVDFDKTVAVSGYGVHCRVGICVKLQSILRQVRWIIAHPIALLGGFIECFG